MAGNGANYVGGVARITVNPRQTGGVPCIGGLRVHVATVESVVADGMSAEEIIAELPPLELCVAAALRLLADAVSGGSSLPPPRHGNPRSQHLRPPKPKEPLSSLTSTRRRLRLPLRTGHRGRSSATIATIRARVVHTVVR